MGRPDSKTDEESLLRGSIVSTGSLTLKERLAQALQVFTCPPDLWGLERSVTKLRSDGKGWLKRVATRVGNVK